MTVYNYLDSKPDKEGNNKAKDFLTMKAICEIGLEILYKKGTIYFRQGKFTEAAGIFQNIIDKYPKNHIT